MLKLKSKNKIFRLYETDLWGTLRLEKKINTLSEKVVMQRKLKRKRFKPFFFDILDNKPVKQKKRLTKYGKFLVERHKICLFYGIVKLGHYRRLCNSAINQKGLFNNFEKNLVYSLEASLVFLLYRVGFVKSLSDGLRYVKLGYVIVNKKVIKESRFIASPGDVIEIINFKKEATFLSFLGRLERKEVLMLESNYMTVSYSNMSFSLLKDFSLDNVYYPFKFNTNFFSAEFRGKI